MSNFMCGTIFDLKDVLGNCFKSNHTKFYSMSFPMCCAFQCFEKLKLLSLHEKSENIPNENEACCRLRQPHFNYLIVMLNTTRWNNTEYLQKQSFLI